MRFAGGVLVGFVIAVSLIAGVSYLAIMNGWIPAAADGGEMPGEEWAAHHALKAVLHRDATAANPMKPTDDTLMAGADIYANNCSGCHGAPKNPIPDFGKGFDPLPTMFGNGDLVTGDPENYTYWKIKHGIKFTGMPSFKYGLKDDQIWQVTTFLKHMDKLPPAVQQKWNNMH